MFRENYGFETETVLLKCHQKKPETQLLRDVTAFAYEHDGHHRTTLLIVYYSGHGYLDSVNGQQELHISGYASESPRGAIMSDAFASNEDPATEDGETTHVPIACWKSIDDHLHSLDADVLVIMDCCFASKLHKSDGQHSRTFEVLAATDNITPSPGPLSYTNALIDILNSEFKLYQSRREHSFDTIHLQDRLCKRLKTYSPSLINRLQSRIARHIRLAPLEPPSTSEKPHKRVDRSIATLRIEIDFGRNKSLSQKEATDLGKALAAGAKNAKLNITGLNWIEFVPRIPTVHKSCSVTIGAAVLVQMQRAMRRRAQRLSRRKRSHNEASNRDSRKRQRTTSSDQVDTPPPSSPDNNL